MFALVGVGGLLSVDRLVERPWLLAPAAFGVATLEEFIALPNVSLGVFNVKPVDVLMLVMLSVAVLRLVRASRLPFLQALLLVMILLAGWSLLRGLSAFGPQAAFNQARGTLPFLAAAIAASTFSRKHDCMHMVFVTVTAAAAVLGALAWLRFIADVAGLGGVAFLHPTASEGRVMDAYPALIILQGVFLSLVLASQHRGMTARRYLWLSGALFVAVIFMQQRTVWVALIAAAVIFVKSRMVTPRVGRLVVMGTVIVVATALTLGLGDQPVSEELQATATQTSTFEWRIEGWRQLLADATNGTASQRLMGYPFGRPFVREVNTREVDSQPHNFYVQSMLRIGALGLTALMSVLALSARRLWKWFEDPGSSVVAGGLLAVLATQTVFFISYGPGFEQGILLGCTVAAVLSPRFRAKVFAGSAAVGASPLTAAR